MATYKQDVKEQSRVRIWSHAIESLTTRRDETRILDRTYLTKLSGFVEAKIGRELDPTVLRDFFSYLDLSYGKKDANELKVAFFCGPEPENDVDVLLSLGVRLENMFAFELGNKEFKQAVDALRGKYPQLKIFNGNIETYSQLHNTLFDIIYLDFTGTLNTCFKTVCSVLDNNMLSPFGVLAVNTTHPDKTEENIDFLSRYFFYDTMFERSVIEGDERYEDFMPGFGRVEGASCYGWNTPDDLRPYIEEYFEDAYSAFQSDFINGYANITKPIYSIMSQSILQKRLFKLQLLDGLLKYEKAYNQMDFDYFNDGVPLFSMKFRMLDKDDPIYKHFDTNEIGRKFNRIKSLMLWELLVNAQYVHQYDLDDKGICVDEDGNTIYEKIDILSYLADPLVSAVKVIEDMIKPKKMGTMFCDLPMIHLWLEMIVNSLGYPYHANLKNHERHRYTAKERQMSVDVFTFDQCRGLYDWLPMIEYQADYVKDYDRQLISRMCVDAIAKNSLGVIQQQYFGSAIVGEGEQPWAHFYDFPKRVELTEEKESR